MYMQFKKIQDCFDSNLTVFVYSDARGLTQSCSSSCGGNTYFECPFSCDCADRREFDAFDLNALFASWTTSVGEQAECEDIYMWGGSRTCISG